MNTSQPATGSFQDLVEVLHDGQNLYETALKHVQAEPYRGVFQRMAALKRDHAAELAKWIRSQGASVPEGGTFIGSIRQAYGGLIGLVSSKPAESYVAQLEDAEDRILKAFQEAAQQIHQPAARERLTPLLTAARREHDEMRGLKQGLKRAA